MIPKTPILVESLTELEPYKAHEYTFDHSGELKSEHRLLLYSTCVFLYKSVQPEHYQQIHKQHLSTSTAQKTRKEILDFINTLSFRNVSLTSHAEAQLLRSYISMRGSPHLKLILHFQESHEPKKQVYVCCFLYDELLIEYIGNFCVLKKTVPNDFGNRKIIIDKMVAKPQTVMDAYIQRDNVLFLFGETEELIEYQRKFLAACECIQCKKFDPGDKFLKNYNFTRFRTLTEKYFETKLFTTGDSIIIYYKHHFQGMFQNSSYEYKEIPYSKLKNLVKKDNKMQEFILTHPDIMRIQKEKKIVGKPYIIDQLQKYLENREKFLEGDSYQNIDSIVKEQLPPKYTIKIIKNIEVYPNQQLVFLQTFSSYKNLSSFQYRIESFDNYVRIANYTMKVKKIYLIYRNYAQMLNLLSFVSQEIDLKIIREFLEEQERKMVPTMKEVQCQNDLILYLYPWLFDRTQFIKEVEENKEFNKTIACSKEILEKILSQYKFNWNVIFLVNEKLPFFEFLNLSSINQTKIHLKPPYESQVKFLNRLFKLNAQEYRSDRGKMSIIDQYNYVQAAEKKLTEFPFVISSRAKKQYVYLTYHEKYFRICRDDDKFVQLAYVGNWKQEITPAEEKQLKQIGRKAFLIGQQYVSFSIPFDICLNLKVSEVKRHRNNKNFYLLLYWEKKLMESQKVVKIKAGEEKSLEKQFSTRLKIKFDDEKIEEEIKQVKVNYGYFRKFREGEWVGIEAEAFMWQKILKRFITKFIGDENGR